jgi:hypothetical protein
MTGRQQFAPSADRQELPFLPHCCELRHVHPKSWVIVCESIQLLPTMKIVNKEKETSSSAQRFKVAVVQASPVVFDRLIALRSSEENSIWMLLAIMHGQISSISTWTSDLSNQ